jgi:hypothetical protein
MGIILCNQIQMYNDTDPFAKMLDSTCKIQAKDITYLRSLLKKKVTTSNLLYRGSIHGWMREDFHSRCIKRGPTISLFQILDGDCIGGFTSAEWDFSGF